ncbi:MAG: NADH-quinone oxidoreductase subunit N [Chloroflexota bacterium]|nr:NADH-quinone oxidoreductase subunit N [Chloroflexota bacterium]
MSINTLWLLLPELILLVAGVLVLVFDMAASTLSRDAFNEEISESREVPWLPYLALTALVVALLSTGLIAGSKASISGMVAVDAYAIFFKIIATVAVSLVVLSSVDYMRGKPHAGEFYAFLLFATAAVCLAAGATNLIMIYLALEFLSLTSAVLVCYKLDDPKSTEAALKYFLFGVMASAVLLYGMSLIYGATGTTDLKEIARAVGAPAENWMRYLVYPGLVMLLAGFGFKIAAVPFHMWAPDTYAGAPTPVTAFLSVASKAAGFAVLVRVLVVALPGLFLDWTWLLAFIAAITMTLGNVVAIVQKDMKRMLAYSSIAQAGYVLIGVVAMGKDLFGAEAALLYILGYLFTNLGLFLAVIAVERATGSTAIADYAGLGRRAPFLAVVMVAFFLSLMGFPSTAGFVGKLFVFAAAVRENWMWLAGIGVLNSVISAYYYFNVVRQMYFQPMPEGSAAITDSVTLRVGLVISVVMLFVVGLYPQPFIELVQLSSRLM